MWRPWLLLHLLLLLLLLQLLLLLLLKLLLGMGDDALGGQESLQHFGEAGEELVQLGRLGVAGGRTGLEAAAEPVEGAEEPRRIFELGRHMLMTLPLEGFGLSSVGLCPLGIVGHALIGGGVSFVRRGFEGCFGGDESFI